jgi:uncharacterized membrane protein (UPF0127 family)
MPSFLTPLLDSHSEAFSLRNLRTGQCIADQVIRAFDSASRRRGLLHRDSFPDGAALLIAPCSAIHTWFMRFPIDVAFLARDGRIVKIRSAVGPWRLTAAMGAYAVMEMTGGALVRSGTRVGDQVVVVRRLTL